jgi:exodeoxyribonuclease V beta subunit
MMENMCRRHTRPDSHLPLAARLVHQAYTTPVRLGDTVIAGLASANVALREVEFLFPIPERAHPLLSHSREGAAAWNVERGVVKGFVDLLFEHEGRVFVCDWKSDSLPRFDPETLARHCEGNYDVQTRIYAIATLRLCGIATADDYARRFGGVVFCFLRGLRDPQDSRASEGAGSYFFKPAWDDILAWETEMLGQQFWGISR